MLKAWLIENRFGVVDYMMFKEFFIGWVDKNIPEKERASILDRIDWEKWINGEGFPPKNSIKAFTSKEYDITVELADKFVQFNGAARPTNWMDFRNWYPA